MGMVKNYLNDLACWTDKEFGQQAIDHAIKTGAFKPCGNLDADYKTIAACYDAFCEALHKFKGVKVTGTITYEHSELSRAPHNGRTVSQVTA